MHFYWMHRWNAAAFPNPKQMVITSVPGVVSVIEKAQCAAPCVNVIANIKVQQLAFYTSEVSQYIGMKIHHIKHGTRMSPEIDNISAKRRKFVNVVDPHIKKERPHVF